MIDARQTLKHAVMKAIMCQTCQAVLDVRRAVACEVTYADTGKSSGIVTCVTCWDKIEPTMNEMISMDKFTSIEILDGRELHGREKK